MSAIDELYALQDTDIALDKALARLAEIEESLGEPEELIATRESARTQSAEVHALKVLQKDAELAVDDIKGKAAEVEKKLYAGTVKDPKELQNLDKELKSMREQVKTREEELLAILEQVDAAETGLHDLEVTGATLESEWKALREQLLAQKAQLEPEAAKLKVARDAQASDVDRRMVSLYDLLRQRRGGQAVAKIERGMCQGCRISLPMSILQRARSGVTVVQCVSCERILLNT